MRDMPRVGGCACGTVRYALDGTSWCAHSHRPLDRALHAAPMVTWSGVRADRFQITQGADSIAIYEPGGGEQRHFCSRCGTHLYVSSPAWFQQVHVAVATFDEGPARRPAGHLFFDQRADWLTIGDRLTRFGGEGGSQHLDPREQAVDPFWARDPAVRLASRWDAPDLEGLLQAYDAERGRAGFIEPADAGSVGPPVPLNATALEAAALRDRLTHPEGLFMLVAEVEQRVVGFAVLAVGPVALDGGTKASLDALFVDPAHRLGGLGRALVAQAVASASALGAHRLECGVPKGAASETFFARVGFRALSGQPHVMHISASQA